MVQMRLQRRALVRGSSTVSANGSGQLIAVLVFGRRLRLEPARVILEVELIAMANPFDVTNCCREFPRRQLTPLRGRSRQYRQYRLYLHRRCDLPSPGPAV